MKKFLIQLFLFTAPVILYLIIPTYVLWQSKEAFFKIDKILSGKEKYLIGYAYHENNYGFVKWAYLNSNENKSVWALGSSRVLQFRGRMFDTTFYNAGYTISSINDFEPFIQSLPKSKHPQYIIVGLDQWMFNASYDNLNSTPSPKSWQSSFTFIPKIFPTYKTCYADLFAGKYTLNTFNKQHSNFISKIGLNAIVNNTGFRNDGSIYYGSQIQKLINKDTTANDFNNSNTFDRIKHGNRHFEYCKSVNEKALIKLSEFLNYCKSQQINVIAFLPPFADKVYSKMVESGNYLYLIDLYQRIKPIFEKYDFEVYDFSKVALCNSSDNETIDGFHGGELTYQKILISILDSGSILRQVTNVNRLKDDIINRKNSYIVYDN